MVLAAVASIVVASCGQGDTFGTAWGGGSFDSNGERIYFTATNDQGEEIDYEGGRGTGGMMMAGRLSCASCHGPDARGGDHRMHMDSMSAPNIRWVALTGEVGGHGEADDHDADHGDAYDVTTFRSAVVDGVHPNGEPLSRDMPRWSLSDADLRDLVDYLSSFDTP